MSLTWILKNFLAALLLPPFNGLWLLLLALIFRRRGWALPLAIVAGALLWAQSLKPVAQFLIAPLERPARSTLASAQGAGAIVVLGGGRARDAPEYGGETVAAPTLERLRFAAQLARRFSLPLLTAGGKPDGGVTSEADAMALVLQRDFALPVRWRDGRSDDTAENAAEAAAILKAARIGKILLVTHAYHMPRARELFERHGLSVVPAPTGFKAEEPLAPQDWLPQASSLSTTRLALHEWIGLAWSAVGRRL